MVMNWEVRESLAGSHPKFIAYLSVDGTNPLRALFSRHDGWGADLYEAAIDSQ